MFIFCILYVIHLEFMAHNIACKGSHPPSCYQAPPFLKFQTTPPYACHHPLFNTLFYFSSVLIRKQTDWRGSRWDKKSHNFPMKIVKKWRVLRIRWQLKSGNCEIGKKLFFLTLFKRSSSPISLHSDHLLRCNFALNDLPSKERDASYA